MDSLNDKDFNQDPLDLIKKLKPMESRKSKQEVWAELELMLQKPAKKTGNVISIFAKKWQIAASIVLLVAACFLGTKFYSKTVKASPGKQEIAVLPDGSTVHLNSKSEIAYNPIWWAYNREVHLTGEAFFKVQKGKKFTVISPIGTTTVVGTSFNIFARDNDYEVTCLTGKVKVVSLKTNEKVLITPNQMVKFSNTGNIQLNLAVNAKLATAWAFGKFVFTQVPIDKVLREISLRYGVVIKDLSNSKELYTGDFNKEKNIELALNLVCKPFGLEYKKLPSGAYLIQKAP
ncbi:FecR domain-containing protein [Pedobacter sp. SD-b]|uniref:FecR domain-containing protein n=1 Tax=Pedobacter segetis TaxID=2793069 RepID=A0ABS1BH73_9SPHI|nr:FecR family protein [Pedobacter segetis]MBK0382131.1 FecR domain-containing protein [Pedobacter segetis]